MQRKSKFKEVDDCFQSERYNFPKSERLHHHSLVEGLFRNGKSFYEFPFRVTWRLLSDEELRQNFRNTLPENIGKVQILVAVPKKKRKRAVDRVKLRRRIREAYRLSKNGFIKSIEAKPSVGTFSLAIVYIHDKTLPYEIISGKVKTVLTKLESKIADTI